MLVSRAPICHPLSKFGFEFGDAVLGEPEVGTGALESS